MNFRRGTTEPLTERVWVKQIKESDLSNEQIRAKINEQLQREEAARQIHYRPKPKWMKELDWNKLLQTKLFNNPQRP